MRNSRFILVPNASVFDHGRQVNDCLLTSQVSDKQTFVTTVFIKIAIKGDRPSTDAARR